MRVAPNVPEIVEDVEDDAACVLTLNVLLVVPAATVTLAGTVAADVLLLDSATTAPPDGAGPVSVTVPCDEVPPATLAGLREIAESVGCAVPGVTVSTVAHVVFNRAHTRASVVDDTDVVATLNVAVDAPAGTVMLDGTVAGPALDI